MKKLTLKYSISDNKLNIYKSLSKSTSIIPNNKKLRLNSANP